MNKNYNEYCIEGNIVIGKSSNTDDTFFVDLCDFDKIKDISWSVRINHNGMKELCGWSPEFKKTTRMHIVLGFSNYDHIDRNELNNCRSNLRKATTQEQIWNRRKTSSATSKVVGVSYYAKSNKWVAELTYNRKRVFRKYFDTEEEAVNARLNAEVQYIPTEFAPNRHLYKKYNINTN